MPAVSEILFEVWDRATGIRVSWSGPRTPTSAELVPGVASIPGFLDVLRPDSSRPEVWVAGGDGLVERVADSVGPPMFEETDYRVVVECPSGHNVRLHQRDERLVRDVTQVGSHRNIVAGLINFKRQVGIARFSVVLDGVTALHVAVEVMPTKIDARSDYVAMKADVDSAVRGLAFEYLRSTTQSVGLAQEQPRWNLEWLTILRNELSAMSDAINHINRFPHRQLRRDTRQQPIHKIRRPSTTLRKMVRRGQGHGALQDLGPFRVRSVVMSERSRESLDTAEHRWLRSRLQRINSRLARLQMDLETQLAQLESAGRSTKLIEIQINEVKAIRDRVSQLLRSHVMSAASRTAPFHISSMTLAQAPGYREAHRGVTHIDRALTVEADTNEVSYKDLDELYQIWCFISIIEVVRTALGAPSESASLFSATESGLRVSLRGGKARSVGFTSKGDTLVTITAEPRFEGPTGTQIPDIVIGIERSGWPELLIVLDAKYRIDASQRYVSRFGCPGPPIDAVNALHRYRDAVVVQSGETTGTRPVVRGAAVFPFPLTEEDFQKSSLHEALPILGIGALPLLPEKTRLASSWIRALLSESSSDLSEPGPPFTGLAAKYGSKS